MELSLRHLKDGTYKSGGMFPGFKSELLLFSGIKLRDDRNLSGFRLQIGGCS